MVRFLSTEKFSIWRRSMFCPQDTYLSNNLHMSLNNIWEYYGGEYFPYSIMMIKEPNERKVTPKTYSSDCKLWYSGQGSRQKMTSVMTDSEKILNIIRSGLDVNEILGSLLHTILHRYWKERKHNNHKNSIIYLKTNKSLLWTHTIF